MIYNLDDDYFFVCARYLDASRYKGHSIKGKRLPRPEGQKVHLLVDFLDDAPDITETERVVIDGLSHRD